MDKVGITKEVDKLGRIVIPKDLRDMFMINKEVEIIVTSDGILLRNPQYMLIKKASLAKSTDYKHM